MPCLPEFYYRLQCRDSLQELALPNRVRLVSVGGKGEADALATRTGSSSACLPLAPSNVKWRERGWLFKSQCASWSLKTACLQSRMWLKKPNPVLTRYFLRLTRTKLRILVGRITGHCPLNKHLHNMGLIDESSCIACEMEDESEFVFYVTAPV
jgi:hypothetical protein